MFKMVWSNHRGTSATGKRGGEQWGKNKTKWMKLKQNADEQKRQSREGQRQKVSGLSDRGYCSHFAVFYFHFFTTNEQKNNKYSQFQCDSPFKSTFNRC